MRGKFRQLAESVVSRMREELGIELKYDQESIEWLDGYIERIRPELKEDSYSGLATTLGAYVGETIIATYGGSWDYFEKEDSGLNERANQVRGLHYDHEPTPLLFATSLLLTISQSGIKYRTNQGVAIGGVRTLIE
jgi:hypothetical protein